MAVVTVGDELLAGDTTNTNATWLCQQLSDRGVTVRRVIVVPDEVDEIAREVNEARAEYDAVIVTGGLGPTHDDVTMDAVAAAVGRQTEQHEAVLEWLEEHGGYSRSDLTEGTALLPVGAEILHNEVGVAPGCVVESIYVLPGVPEEMKAMFGTVAAAFSGPERHVEIVPADEPESALLDQLSEVRDQFTGIDIGSYPGDVVRLKVSGTDAETVEAAAAWLSARVDTPEQTAPVQDQ